MDVVHRACDGHPSRPPAVVVDLAWGPLTRHGAGGGNLQRSVSATRATSTFGLLKPISFIPWLWNGQVWPKGPYPNQTKPNQINYHRSSFILRITYPQSSVTPPLAGPSGRRPPGMWRSPEPSPGSGGPPGLRATHAAWRRWWQPQKARLDHPGDVHFGPLKPISFIPWLCNGQVWPKGPYPNQTNKNKLPDPPLSSG